MELKAKAEGMIHEGLVNHLMSYGNYSQDIEYTLKTAGQGLFMNPKDGIIKDMIKYQISGVVMDQIIEKQKSLSQRALDKYHEFLNKPAI